MFSPPSPEQFEAHLNAHPAHPPGKWQLRAPLLAVAALLVISLMTTGPLSALLPWVALIWLFGHNWYRTRRSMELEGRVRQVQEKAQLRHVTAALRDAWRLLPQLTAIPPLHSQTVALMAHCLDYLCCYDAAIVGYDYLLERLPNNEPIAVHIGVCRANAALGAERLSDADDTIRRLRGAIEPYKGTTIGAAYRLAQLAQHVRTHHFMEAVQENQDLLEAMRPLGIEAGYGHALMALCYERLAAQQATQDAGEAPANNTSYPETIEEVGDKAKLWWQRATLLLPIPTLERRYPELTPLKERL
ncbi:MAG: hypothetical protein Kow00105_08450 [Phycisphaeraceae bacterium]